MLNRPALARQRRLLVLMSLTLSAFYVLKVHVKGEAEYSGLAVALLRPERVQYCVWVVFGWALWRYIQRLNELWRKVSADIRKDVDVYDQDLVLNVARRYAERKIKREGIPGIKNPRITGGAWPVPSVKQIRTQTSKLSPASPPKPEPGPWFKITQCGGRKYETFGVPISYRDNTDTLVETGYDVQLPEWNRWRTWQHRSRAWVRAAIGLPAVFEHLAPLAMAAGAVGIAISMIYLDHRPPLPPQWPWV